MPRILIVDDEDIDREAAERYLRPLEDLEVLLATEGNQALELVASGAPDLMLTDLRMPGMDGLELVERMRSEYPLVPVILMTSQGNERIAVQALQAGAASYVPKRELKEELVDTVLQVLEVAEAGQSRSKLLGYLQGRETSFELENDPALIFTVAAFLQDSLERLGFANETVRSQVGMALVEAISNAMIHGNLEVDSSLRQTDRSGYERLIDERRGQDPYSQRHVHCTCRETTEEIVYVFSDDGPGFDPQKIPDPTDPANILRASGRGIMLMRTFMDRVEFNDKGNQITLVKQAGAAPSDTE
jgi:CheY-like chemotaxis protein/anti-sigma regulatory factor (Ser/Thr protein kinase)